MTDSAVQQHDSELLQVFGGGNAGDLEDATVDNVKGIWLVPRPDLPPRSTRAPL